MSRRLSIPARCSGRLKATIDAFAITVLSRSKKAATRRGSSGGEVGHPPRVAARSRGPIDPLSGCRRVTYRRRRRPQAAASARTASPDAPHRGRAAVAPSEEPMLLACWSSKGGAGTTVVAATLALLLGRSRPGRRAARRPGRRRAGRPRPHRSREPGHRRLAGRRARRAARRPPPARGPRRRRPRPPPPRRRDRCCPTGPTCSPASSPPTAATVVVDCGTDPSGVALAVAASATRSVLVTRRLLPRRSAGPLALPLRPSEVVLLTEPGRALGRGRRRAHGGRAGRRRGRRRPAGRPGRRRRAARPAACRAASPGIWPVPPDVGRRPRRTGWSTTSTPRCSPTDPERGTDLPQVLARGAARPPAAPQRRRHGGRQRGDGAGRGARAASSRCSPTTPSPR